MKRSFSLKNHTKEDGRVERTWTTSEKSTTITNLKWGEGFAQTPVFFKGRSKNRPNRSSQDVKTDLQKRVENARRAHGNDPLLRKG